jgi:hypothetical protein
MGKCKSFITSSLLLAMGCRIDWSRYVWWARKPEDASTNDNPQDPVRDDEILESDEDDNYGENDTESANVTNAPLPTATDATQASVEQLSALAVSSKDDTEEEKDKTPSTSTDTATTSS